MRLLDNLLPRSEERLTSNAGLPFEQFMKTFAFNANRYGLDGSPASMPGDGFEDYVESIHKLTPVVSSAAVSRALLMSQVRFLARSDDGSTSSPPALNVLRRPGAVKRSAFLHLMEMHASYAGAAYPVLRNGKLFLLRPDWVTVVLGSDSDPVEQPDSGSFLPPSDAVVTALLYQPVVNGRKGRMEVFQAGEFARWTPEPDPVHWWRGVSWVSSVLREYVLDGQVTHHQQQFFEKAATPHLVFIMDPTVTAEQTKEYAEVINRTHTGENRHKNMFLGGGTDVKIVGSDLDKLGLKDLSGAFETRVASRSMVPAVILGIREGLGGSALNSGNYGQTRRQWADKWYTPHVDGLCESLEDVVSLPSTRELSWDRSRVMFLQEDQKDAADIASTNAAALRQLVDGGFEPDSVISAVSSGDMSKLRHTGNLSVQLQPPGMQDDDDDDDPEPEPADGKRSMPLPPAPTAYTFNFPEQRHTIEVSPAPTPDVHVTNEIIERAQPAPVVHVDAPTVNIEAPTVHVDVPAPVERADAPPVVNVTVEPTPVTIENHVETPRSKHRVKRDGDGKIIEIDERPA